jgi:hypothetical protein
VLRKKREANLAYQKFVKALALSIPLPTTREKSSLKLFCNIAEILGETKKLLTKK